MLRTRMPQLLENGDRMTQPEFHRRYEQYPEDIKFELVGGTVYMTSPLRRRHGRYHPELSGVFWLYKNATPGVEVLDNTTMILGEESEPQPDLALRILSEYGGRSRTNKKGYIGGAAELMAEKAHSKRSNAVHQKRSDHQRAGVLEYVVVCLEEYEIHWFDFRAGGELKADAAGIFRSQAFPGLWLDGQALLAGNSRRLIEVVQQGLSSPEHAAFVKRLAATRRRRSANGRRR